MRRLLTYPYSEDRVPLAGDIVCFRDPGNWISDGIAWFTRSRGESLTKCSHVGIMADGTNICESLATTKIHPLAPRLDGNLVTIYRHTGLTESQRERMEERCSVYEGNPYGYLKIVAHALDHLIGGAYFFRRMCRLDNYPICSWLVAWVYWKCAGIEFKDTRPNATQPDDIRDECEVNPLFELIWTNEQAKGQP